MKLPGATLLALALAACGGRESDAVSSLVTTSVPAPASVPLDDDPSKPGRTHVSFSFDELDLNDDGSVARTESAFDAALSESFDDDGKLSRLEVDVARAAAQVTRKSTR